ncbi:MAG: hypothetical protein ACKVQS_07335 [Fimbriimonadaceae bacterium]
MNRFWAILGIGAIGFVIVARLLVGGSVGKSMPEFSMKTLDGAKFTNRDIVGRVAVFYVSGEG